MYKKIFSEYFKKVLTFRDYSIYDVEHSVDRYNQRIGKSIFLYEKLLKKGINYIISKNLDKVEDRYLWYSKKYEFGIQIEWRLNREKTEFGGYTATTLSEDEMKCDRFICILNSSHFIKRFFHC